MLHTIICPCMHLNCHLAWPLEVVIYPNVNDNFVENQRSLICEMDYVHINSCVPTVIHDSGQLQEFLNFSQGQWTGPLCLCIQNKIKMCPLIKTWENST